MGVVKVLAFIDMLILAGTGIAVVYTGCSILTSYVAYLSPWMPPWAWGGVVVVGVLGVMITATSVAGAVAAIAPKPHAFKLCLSLLLVIILAEVSASFLVYRKQELLGQALSSFMKQKMIATQVDYGDDITDTQLWDEIQLEVNCCGTKNYKDWFSTAFSNGTDVPDSCCLIVENGCGRDIVHSPQPSDDIILEGCLPTITHAMALSYKTLATGVWMPVCTIHVALMLMLAALQGYMEHDGKGSDPGVFSVSAILPPHSQKYSVLSNQY